MIEMLFPPLLVTRYSRQSVANVELEDRDGVGREAVVEPRPFVRHAPLADIHDTGTLEGVDRGDVRPVDLCRAEAG